MNIWTEGDVSERGEQRLTLMGQRKEMFWVMFSLSRGRLVTRQPLSGQHWTSTSHSLVLEFSQLATPVKTADFPQAQAEGPDRSSYESKSMVVSLPPSLNTLSLSLSLHRHLHYYAVEWRLKKCNLCTRYMYFHSAPWPLPWPEVMVRTMIPSSRGKRLADYPTATCLSLCVAE